MIHITEDTPPDMLSGAMDLTVHLPSGKSVKMCVERSTPMMDLLVQVTTKYQLQITNYTLQALQMAPSSEYSDKILPYYPNTPIGALDIQHVKVVPKQKSFTTKNFPSGHQPFESTFRLKVHLPRNQLFVTRVGRNIHLGDIMKKVCEEKNLDPLKYECRHPGNLGEVLDPKLTLNDYMITEIYLVNKGSKNINQFSTNDIMTSRKEEERKQMHTKTGGGVFNLIFRRGKHNTGSGSVSTDNSSPPNSDESRSITPPAVQPPVIPLSIKEQEKPKVPLRKRRPAPKPPQQLSNTEKKIERRTSTLSDNSTSDAGTVNSLTICHSRNSSDSSGYHETSILSDHCNTSLPRRPKSMMQQDEGDGSKIGKFSSMSNLTKMTTQSRSTSSLALGRKKKAAPPPPPIVASPQNSTKSETTTLVAASHSPAASSINSDLPLDFQGTQSTTIINPIPATRRRKAPVPLPRNSIIEDPQENQAPAEDLVNKETTNSASKNLVPEYCDNVPKNENELKETSNDAINVKDEKQNVYTCPYHQDDSKLNCLTSTNELEKTKPTNLSTTDILKSLDYLNLDENGDSIKPPEIIAVIPKTSDDSSTEEKCSIVESSNRTSIESKVSLKSNEETLTDEIKRENVLLYKMDKNKGFKKDLSISSLKSSDSVDFVEGQIKRWGSVEKLDELSLSSDQKWVVGDQSEAESVSSLNSLQISQNYKNSAMNESKDDTFSKRSLSLDIIESCDKGYPSYDKNLHDSGNSSDISDKSKSESPSPTRDMDDEAFLNKDSDWSYDLPSPPKAFKDDTPVDIPETPTEIISKTLHPPDLIAKLKNIEEQQNEKFESSEKMCNKLSLESLEKRKTLVYNRELTTSLKMEFKDDAVETFSMRSSQSSDSLSKTYSQFEQTFEDINKQDKNLVKQSTLPNFKITTYNNPKQKINIFEDDTIRSNSESPTLRSNTLQRYPEPMKKRTFATSMENISFENKEFKKPTERIYQPKSDFYRRTLNRSESLSKQNVWSPTKPVTRSKSQVAINRYEERANANNEDGLTKSNSLFDVSGLQSLEVIRIIQNKLNTPRASMENLDQNIEDEKSDEIPGKINNLQYSKNTEETTAPEKIYNYSGPPSINMATWSERPKRPVSIKEDEDYKLGQGTNTMPSKIILNSNKHKNNRVQIKNNTKTNNSVVNFTNFSRKNESQNVSIKVNGSEPISSQQNGNVLIKIRGNDDLFRQPLGNINKNNGQRPHSAVEFPSDFDISRVPIVKAVELKKNIKDAYNNTSVTQINSFNSDVLDANNKFGTYSSTDNLSSSNFTMAKSEPKPVFRTKSFFHPVVKGFRNSDTANNNQSKQSWQPFATLPHKTNNTDARMSNFETNQNVPFSKHNLRRTESSKVKEFDKIEPNFVPPKMFSKLNAAKQPIKDNVPPPAPLMPKFERKSSPKQFQPQVDPRDELLKSIRDFGGKKGLRSRRA